MSTSWKSGKHRGLSIAAMAALVVVMAAVGAHAVETNDQSVDQRQLQECLADGTKNCVVEVPGLQECQDRGEICNVAAERDEASGFKPVTADGAPLTDKDAIAAALRLSTDTHVTSSAATVQRLSWSEFAAREHVQPPAEADASGNVLVVLVDAPAMTDGGPAAKPVEKPSYYVAYDEKTGNPVSTCIGCTELPSTAGN